MTDPTSDPTGDRRAELIAGALADELSADERAELDRLRIVDPTVDGELAALGGVARRVAAVPVWDDVAPSEALAARIAAIAAGAPAEGATAAGATAERASAPYVGPHVAAARSGRGRRPLLVGVAAAACLAIGVGGGVLLAMPRPASHGPAGTLGALEHVDFSGQPSGVEVDGDVVAHTWGTETVLSVDGLPTGASYTVVVVGSDGSEYESGAFLGSDVTVDCRMNAAVLRQDVRSVEIRSDDGREVAVAEVPRVES